jgi:hypothetical protein
MKDNPKILFVFVDGFGLGGSDPDINPLCRAPYPTLKQMLSSAIPLDACLGIDGLPQSATGQATLLTGINAAKAMGRHIEGFPPPSLKKLIEHENLFSKLQKLGKRCTFANAYWIDNPTLIPPRRRSVTTVMTLSALGGVRGKSEMLAGRAVHHDITRWTAHTRGYTGPEIKPEEAADHLLGIAAENDLTLFEYFLTDRAGHSRHPEQVAQSLEPLEHFIRSIKTFSEQSGHLFLLSSDHGNIEDLSIATHTKNPVPLVASGTRAEEFLPLKSLTEVAPAILRLYGG